MRLRVCFRSFLQNDGVMENIKTILQGRQAIYEYLYIAYYRPPDDEFIKTTNAFADIFAALASETGNDNVKNAAERMRLPLPLDENRRLSMNATFSELFFLSGKIENTESRRRVKEVARVEIIKEISENFAECSVNKPTVINLPIDSFPSELYFMFEMAERLVNSVNDGQLFSKTAECQLLFLNNHLLRWSGGFVDEIISRYCNSHLELFYHDLGIVTEYFLRFDSGFLEGL